MATRPESKSSERAWRTLDLTPGMGEMIKPAELIDIDGAAALTLSARRLYNLLIAHAFGPDMGREGSEWTIELAALRGTHESNDRLEESIVALMKTIVTVRLTNGQTRRVALLGGNDMGDPGRRRGTLTYSFDKRLVPLLRESSVFGKLEVEVMRAFSTKYALALYEALARRVRLASVFSEVFPLPAFRELLGVPPGKLETYSNLKLKAIDRAVTEVNALAAWSCEVAPLKTGRKVTAVRLGWRRKSVDELRDTYAELGRSKTGRKARVRRADETVAEELPLPFPPP